MSLSRRVGKLEKALGAGNGRCPACSPWTTLVIYRQDGPDAEPVLEEGQDLPPPCPRCGRPADVTEIVEVVVRSREEVEALNAHRLGREGP
jgi:hypothetical protein